MVEVFLLHNEIKSVAIVAIGNITFLLYFKLGLGNYAVNK